MAKSATYFQPTVDTFGDLSVRARRLGSRLIATTWAPNWDDVYDRVDHKALSNTLIMVAFLLSFALFVVGIFAFDQIMFENAAQAVSTSYYGGVPLDYN